jgi:hypothetical protein
MPPPSVFSIFSGLRRPAPPPNPANKYAARTRNNARRELVRRALNPVRSANATRRNKVHRPSPLGKRRYKS